MIAASLAALAAGGAAPARGLAGCTRTVSASSDVQQLLRSLPVGATACLRGGVYHGRLIVDRPLTLSGSKGAAIVGGVTIEPAATGTTLEELVVRGSGNARAAIVVRANGVQLLHNRVSGTGFLNLNTACVYLEGTRGAVVDRNHITLCTFATSSTLSAPGVFVGSAYGAKVTNNVIVHTVGYGIVLGPNAQHSSVVHNLVDANLGGIDINGNRKTASSYNVVRNNIFSNSLGANVHARWTGAVGKRDAVASNCLWHGGDANQAPGVQLTGNLVADPHYANPPADYTITGGTCADKRPAIVSAHFHALPAFRVMYRLRALASRVQVVSLAVRGVSAGSRVSARCASRCSLQWSGQARGGVLQLTAFASHWLPKGATVIVRATKVGFAGVYARIDVVGLPQGVEVRHGCLWPGGMSPVSCSGFR